MAKDKGQVRRVLQILSPEDQETLAILHDPPRMEELIRRQETLAEVKAAGLSGSAVKPFARSPQPQTSGPELRFFPSALDELAWLPSEAHDHLLQVHLSALLAAPRQGLELTQLFQGLWLSVCSVQGIDYRVVYDIDPTDAGLTILMIDVWDSLESRLESD